MRIAIPTTGKRKLANKAADTFARAPAFTIVTLEDLDIKDVEVLENPVSSTGQGAGPLAAKVLRDNKIDVLISGELGPGARTILEAFNIKTYEVSVGKKVSEIIEEWKKTQL